MTSRRQSQLVRLVPVLLAVFVLGFYIFTLAPTVLWGDDAFFQRIAYAGEFQPDGSNHWLWLQIARLFTRLPVGDVAYRVNLLSAVAAAATVVCLYFVGRALGLTLVGALATAVALAVSHTFWMHAVRAEVYTLFTFLLTLQLYGLVRWRAERPGFLYWALGLWGMVLLSHQMAVLVLPAVLILILQQRRWLSSRRAFWAGASWLLGLVPFFLVVYLEIARPTNSTLLESLRLYFTHSGSNFSDQLLDFSIGSLPRDGVLWLGFWGLQFVGAAGLLGLAGVWAAWRDGFSPRWLMILLLYITSAAFAFSYHVNDQFVFYLPSYLAFALFVGAGWDWLARRYRQAAKNWTAALLLIALMPPLVYAGGVRLMQALDVNPLGIRTLPEREPNEFFLWPGKRGYEGAAIFGLVAFETLPPEAVLLADHTPVEPLRYLQTVAGVRPDVQLVRFEPAGVDLAPIIQELPPGTAVFLADNNPEYYNLTRLPEASLTPVGPIYRLTFQSDSAGP